jgi:hypothetical protein
VLWIEPIVVVRIVPIVVTDGPLADLWRRRIIAFIAVKKLVGLCLPHQLLIVSSPWAGSIVKRIDIAIGSIREIADPIFWTPAMVHAVNLCRAPGSTKTAPSQSLGPSHINHHGQSYKQHECIESSHDDPPSPQSIFYSCSQDMKSLRCRKMHFSMSDRKLCSLEEKEEKKSPRRSGQ